MRSRRLSLYALVLLAIGPFPFLDRWTETSHITIRGVLPLGSTIAGYRIEQVLGEGQMGTVFLARSPDLPRFESLKVLNSEFSGDSIFEARFLQEAEVAAQLSHPNIVTVYRRGRHNDHLWIAMEHVPGTDADTALISGQMTPARAAHVIEHIAKALDYAHARDLVHRDVKPANFLLSGDSGPDERVLLGDFGVARYRGQGEGPRAGAVFATVAYAAPEVLSGQPSDGRADLYSLGCSLFRLLTGRTPFPGGPTSQVIEAHLTAPPPRVTDFVPGLPAAIDDVIARAMDKDPARRYQSGGELADAVHVALGLRSGSALSPIAVAPRQIQRQRAVTDHAVAAAQVGRKPFLIGLGLAAAGAATVFVVSLALGNKPADGTPGGLALLSPPPSEPLVEPASAARLLMSEDQISSIMGRPMRTTASTNKPIDYSARVTSTECEGAYGPLAQTVYAGSGYTGLEATNFTASDRTPEMGSASVQQAVVVYPSASAATTARDRQLSGWRACANRTAFRRVEPDDPTVEVKFADVVETSDGTLLLAQALGMSGLACDRALGVKNNVVIDAIVCQSDSATPQVLSLVRGIAARVG